MENNVNVFEVASRQKLRFDTPRGQVTVEDLWDLPLTSTVGKPNLDAIAVELHQKMNQTSLSFVSSRTKDQTEASVKFAIVKHVIDVKMAEAAEAANARERAEKRNLILGEINRRQEQELLSMPLDELKKMAENL